MTTARMRVFAGPNGSGKTTLKDILDPVRLGIYVNADDIGKSLDEHGCLDFAAYNVSPAGLQKFIADSTFEGVAAHSSHLSVDRAVVRLSGGPGGPYLAAAFADYIREQLILAHESFSFETVMSSRAKLQLMQRARVAGYRVYLYYVATSSPEINKLRVALRVQDGGHNVPALKIEERYFRSLSLLSEAIRLAHRAYIFDNSGDGEDQQWVAEATDGLELDIKTAELPAWVEKYVVEPLRYTAT